MARSCFPGTIKLTYGRLGYLSGPAAVQNSACGGEAAGGSSQRLY